ncbi:hypothetical protein [Halovenus salina]|uniref:Uncharacterized protein n=1 Tax=Halovenus salina TaxID=1510225 RepID=A0ABD5W377_9EURY|nr:hypothetical protein [Halovenus salina]
MAVPRADAVDAETDVPLTIADEKSDSDESEAAERTVSETVTNEYAYEFQDIRKAIHNGFEIRDWLTDTVGFDSADVFYSGQGVHIFAKSDDPYLKLTHQSRKYIGRYINERLGFPIDDEVTWDRSRVIRLPYSLHTEVNRIVTPISKRDFNFIEEPALPESIRNNESEIQW